MTKPEKREQAIKDRLSLGYKSIHQAENDIRSLLDRLENARAEQPEDYDDDVGEFIRDMASPTDGPDLTDKELVEHLAQYVEPEERDSLSSLEVMDKVATFHINKLRAEVKELREDKHRATAVADTALTRIEELDARIKQMEKALQYIKIETDFRSGDLFETIARAASNGLKLVE